MLTREKLLRAAADVLMVSARFNLERYGALTPFFFGMNESCDPLIAAGIVSPEGRSAWADAVVPEFRERGCVIAACVMEAWMAKLDPRVDDLTLSPSERESRTEAIVVAVTDGDQSVQLLQPIDRDDDAAIVIRPESAQVFARDGVVESWMFDAVFGERGGDDEA